MTRNLHLDQLFRPKRIRFYVIFFVIFILAGCRRGADIGNVSAVVSNGDISITSNEKYRGYKYIKVQVHFEGTVTIYEVFNSQIRGIIDQYDDEFDRVYLVMSDLQPGASIQIPAPIISGMLFGRRSEYTAVSAKVIETGEHVLDAKSDNPNSGPIRFRFFDYNRRQAPTGETQ